MAKTEKTEDTLKERPSKKNRKKEKEAVAVEKPSIKSKKEKRLLVLPLEASIVSIFLLVLLGAFYVVYIFSLSLFYDMHCDFHETVFPAKIAVIFFLI